MNSVMDDSRLLTLPSNERIRLLPHMKVNWGGLSVLPWCHLTTS
jgi:hypothetical protein